jgi:hypothetical protein
LLAGEIRYAASLKPNQGVVNTAASSFVSLSATNNSQASASIVAALFEKTCCKQRPGALIIPVYE